MKAMFRPAGYGCSALDALSGMMRTPRFEMHGFCGFETLQSTVDTLKLSTIGGGSLSVESQMFHVLCVTVAMEFPIAEETVKDLVVVGLGVMGTDGVHVRKQHRVQVRAAHHAVDAQIFAGLRFRAS